MAGLHFPITADNGSFMRALNEVTASVRDASRQIEAEGGNIDKVISKIKNGLAGLGAGWGFKEVASAIATTRGEFQALEAAFRNMLGSAEDAASLMNQLTNTAATTPFGLQEVATGAKQLLAFGVDAEKVNDTIVRLGDIAAGVGSNLGDLVYLYGTTLTQGRMFTQDLRQFQGRGIPLADELAKQFGVAKDKVGDLVTAGKVGSKEFIAAIESMTGSGSKFGGLMDAQSKTIVGQISNIEDAVDMMFNEIGQSSEGIINTTLGVTSSIIENWETVLLILSDVAAAYGVQKAITVGASAIATASFNAEAKALAALLPAKQESANLDIAEAVTKGRITNATAEKVIAMRREVQSYLEELAAQKASATAEASLAAQKYRTALQQSIAAKAAVAAKREELIASGQICGAYISENAIKEMGVVTEKAKAAAIQSTTAKQEYHAAVTKKKIATEALETATTDANTAAQNINARSTTFLTVAKEGLVKTTKKLYATMMAHPYALIAAAVVALGYGIYKLVTYQTEAEKIADAHKQTTQNLELELAKENERLEDLNNTLKTSKKGSADWKEAKDELVSQYGKYLNGIDSEIERVGYLSDSYKKLTEAVQQSVAARQIAKFQEDNAPNHDELIKSITEKLSGEVVLSDPSRDKNGRIVGNRFRKTKIDKKTQKRWIKALTKKLYLGDDSGMTPMLEDFLQNNKSGVFSMDHFGELVFEARKTQDEYDKHLKDLKERYGYKETSDENKTSNKVVNGDELDKKIKEKKADLAKYKKNSQEYRGLVKEITALEKERAEWGSESDLKKKKTSGPTSAQIASKEENAAGKLADILRKQGQERLRIEQDYEYERWQTRIDLMEEGEAKVLAQQKLDFDKQKTDLGRRLDSELEAELNRQMAVFDAEQNKLAAANKKYAKKTFRDSDIDESSMNAIKKRYDKLNADLLAKQKNAENDRLKSAREAMDSYLKEFGSYGQKRKVIETEYSRKIDEAPDAGTRKMLMAQRNRDLADLDFNEWQENGGMALAFGDISRLSKETVKQLISDMERYRSKIIDTFDPDKIQKYEEALNKLRDADIDSAFIFAGDNELLEPLRERLALQKQIADQADNEAALLVQKKKIEEELNALTLQMTALSGPDVSAVGPDGVKTGPEQGVISNDVVKKAEELQVKLAAVDKSLQSSKVSGKELRSELAALGKVKYADIRKFSKSLLDAGKNADDLASVFSDDVGDAIQEGADKVGVMFDAFTELSSNIELLAKSGKEAVKDTADNAKNIVDGVSGGMEATAASTSTSLSTLEKASAILAIIGAAIQLATLVASMFNKDKKHEKTIQELQDRIDGLKRSYDKLGKAAEKVYSTDASNLIRQQDTLLRQQKTLIQQQMYEEESKKKSDKEKVQQYRERIDEINETLQENIDKAKEAVIGEDMKSAINEFASLYAEAWDDGTDAAQNSMKAVRNIITSALTELLKKNIQPAATAFYNLLATAMSDGILTDYELKRLDEAKNLMDSLAKTGEEQYKALRERYKDLDELREELTDISFDSVRDNFKSLMTDMEASTEDFTENFTEMLRNSLVESLMDNKYDAMLKEWYDEFAEAMDNHALTDSERDSLRQKYDSIIQQGIADREEIVSIIGGGAFSQQASSGSSWDMTQETGEELNGRFTAMVELEATNNTLVSDGNDIAREILYTLYDLMSLSATLTDSGDNDTLLAIKDMVFLQTGYLENIEKYSRYLAAISSDVAEMKDKIRDL